MSSAPAVKSIRDHMYVYEGARHGAARGALLGIAVLISAAATGVFHKIMGSEPTGPIFEGECPLGQFYNLSACVDLALPDLTFFATYFVSVTTMSGMAIGAVGGVVQSLFAKVHQE